MVFVLRWTGLDSVPAGFGPSVVAFGIFDGVHRGHQQVLRQVVAQARAHRAQAVAVTFDPHPSTVHHPDQAAEAIAPLDYRLDLIEALGIDATLVIPYTAAFAATSAEGFATKVLANTLGARAVIVGNDLRFGRGNAGDLTTLRTLATRLGFEVHTVNDVGPSPGSESRRWSSTHVRALLAQGDLEEAALILGRAHRVSARVIVGDGRGRALGFPTANLGTPVGGMIPADGLYAGWLHVPPLGACPLPAAISVGTNPTFGGRDRRVEAHAIGRTDLDLYGEVVACDFTVRLRRTLRFATPDALVDQMTEDVEAALAALRARPQPPVDPC
ncbi:MAG: bifunctional riboflavin kinase/FAD synthetase [Micrococcales bacterium]|nr:bifunctional riboflavin kinase/FAD synthetase [Micrococcales bacterium]